MVNFQSRETPCDKVMRQRVTERTPKAFSQLPHACALCVHLYTHVSTVHHIQDKAGEGTYIHEQPSRAQGGEASGGMLPAPSLVLLLQGHGAVV